MTAVIPAIRYDMGRDVLTAQMMASRLDPFVYETETYSFMPNNLPKLTIGGLLMRLNRLSRLGNLLSEDQLDKLDTARQQADRVKRAWLVAYTNKVIHELNLHVTEWCEFLKECEQDQNECHEMYPSVVEKRVMAQTLTNEARKLDVLTPKVDKQLLEIDSRMEGYFSPGRFIWDPRLQQAYPHNPYAFLYVST